MSCGFTATISTSASFAAVGMSTARNPYRVVNSAARSGCRSENISSSTRRPLLSNPDSNASPIFPAPNTAITGRPSVPVMEPSLGEGGEGQLAGLADEAAGGVEDDGVGVEPGAVHGLGLDQDAEPAGGGAGAGQGGPLHGGGPGGAGRGGSERRGGGAPRPGAEAGA